MADGGRVIVCGQIADYNRDVPYPPPISERMQKAVDDKHITR